MQGQACKLQQIYTASRQHNHTKGFTRVSRNLPRGQCRETHRRSSSSRFAGSAFGQHLWSHFDCSESWAKLSEALSLKIVSCCHDPHAKICKVRSEWHAVCLRSMPKNPKQKLGWMKSAPVSQTFFIAGKNEENFAGQKHIRSSLNNFMSSFASMILIHGFFRPIRVFHNHHNFY